MDCRNVFEENNTNSMLLGGLRLSIEEVKRFLKSKFEDDYSHCEILKGFPPWLMILHSEGVRELALRIGKEEGGFTKVLEVAAWFHDVSTYKEPTSGTRPEVLSAKTAEKFLKDKGYETEFIDNVVDAILSCGLEPVKKPTCMEQKVLSDADALYHLGPTGVMSITAYHASQGKNLERIAQALSQLTENWTIHTETGKRIFENRKRFAQNFVQSLRKEIKGSL